MPPERLVYTFEFEPMAGHILTETVTLQEHGTKTKMTMTAEYATIEDLEGMVNSGMEAGAVESWDRLAELVEMEK